MYAALIVLHVLVSILLVLIVLLQAGRGAELGAAFGSVGQATFTRGRTTFLSKFTTALAVVFMVTSLTLAFLSTEAPRQSMLAPSGETGVPLSPSVPNVPIAPEPVDEPSAAEGPRTLEPTDAPPQE